MHAHEIRIQPATSGSITWQLLSCVQSLERNRDLLLWIFAHQNDARARSDIKVLYFGMDTKSLNTYFRELMQCSSASSVFFLLIWKHWIKWHWIPMSEVKIQALECFDIAIHMLIRLGNLFITPSKLLCTCCLNALKKKIQLESELLSCNCRICNILMYVNGKR